MKKLSIITLASTIVFSASAYADKVAIGPRIGTQGIGLEARTPIFDNVFARINGNYFQYKSNFNKGSIKLDGKLNLLSVPIMLDWHPFEGSGFKISAGVAYNGNYLKATGSAPKGATINGNFYTADQIGSVSAKVTLGNKIAGIASIGYDNSFYNTSPISFNFEVGAMYSGNPKVKVTSTGIANNTAKADVERDIKKSVNSAKKYLRFYPVLAIGLKYSF